MTTTPSRAQVEDTAEPLTREFTPGIHWLVHCLETDAFTGSTIHLHTSAWLVLGGDRTVLIDTSQPANWARLQRQLDRLLAGRPLDFVMPSHPEIAHCGNVGRLMRRYPEAVLVGDTRDYHMYFPSEVAGRMRRFHPDDRLDLGGGYVLRFVDALIKDGVNTLWAYEESQQVLFSIDSFGYAHLPPPPGEDVDFMVHPPTDCGLLIGELDGPPNVEQAAFATRAPLFWTRYVEFTPFLDELMHVLERHPVRFVAPSHGNVVDDVDLILPIVAAAPRVAFREVLDPNRTSS